MRTRLLFAAAVLAAASSVGAQAGKSAFDRTVIPKAGADPTVKLPTWTRTTLSNGAQLVVIERHNLPLISFTMNFIGGSNQIEAADKTGVGSLVNSMMSEGTATKTGDQIADALQLLGSSIFYGIGSEGGSVQFRSLTDKFEPTLAILADEILHPAFPDAALDRLKQRTLVNLRQARDQTPGIAAVVYPKLLYTTDHPYGRTMSEESLNGATRADIVAFHQAFFQPSHAMIVVVGDITQAKAKAALEKAFAGWSSSAGAATFNYPAAPAPKATTIYIVDKPAAAQSTFAIGFAGPPRSTPDYYALQVMNALFGGVFQSRINANIREAKGWSYGVGSSFAYGRGPGAFRMGGDVQTDKTDSALVEFMRELKGVRGDKPVTADELSAAKASLVQSLSRRAATIAGVSGIVSEVYSNGLPDDYWTRFQSAVNGVTIADVQRMAQQYLDPDHLVILIVGDRAKIEAPIRATGIAPVVVLDKNGNPVM
jgi:predicted Zn-dependent peptidase